MSEEEKQETSNNKNGCGIGCLVIVIILMIIGSIDDKEENFDVHKANDENNAIFNNVPPGDKRRQAEADNVITSEKILNQKINTLQKEIEKIQDRYQAGLDINQNEISLLKYKREILKQMADSDSGHGGYWSLDKYLTSNYSIACTAYNDDTNDGPDCIKNGLNLWWKYVHLQEIFDKGSITHEEFEKKKNEYVLGNQRILNDAEKILNLKEIPKAHQDFQEPWY